jgi:biopolymer transport protein ExbD
LSEINITPLLDLAFVLLIIFMITTPLLESSMNPGDPIQRHEESASSTRRMCKRSQSIALDTIRFNNQGDGLWKVLTTQLVQLNKRIRISL